MKMIDEELLITFNRCLLGNQNSPVKKNLVGSSISSYHYYSDEKDQISSIIRGIVKNHPFVDGNKRTALTVLFHLCDGVYNLPDDETMFVILKKIAAETNLSIEQISKLLFEKGQ